MTPRGVDRASSVPDSAGHESPTQSQDWSDIVDATADALVHAFDPLDGSDLHLALTGGRDSRVIAAALSCHDRINATTHTMGTPSEPDVVLAAEIAAISGWTHQVNAPSGSSASGTSLVIEDPVDRITRVLDVHDAMNSAWDDIQGYGPVNHMPIMSGAGGEILRGGLVLTSHSELTPQLAERQLKGALGPSALISSEFASPYGTHYLDMIRSSPHRAADEFYYHERNGRWMTSRRMGARFRRRVIDPLLDNRFIRATRQIMPDVRWSERLVFEVITRLNPNLRDLRMEGNRWRFERESPHPAYPEGWAARSALVRDRQTLSRHWKNLEDSGVRARIDSMILDELQSGPASELLERSAVERFLSNEAIRAPQRWHLATTAVLLSERWWLTERGSIQESITVHLPVPAEDPADSPNAVEPVEQTPAPAISVIVPMHNAERHIRDTLESIAAQSMTDFEVIVVDDGSTDNSSRIVDEFIRLDGRFSRVATQGTGSAGAARNFGLSRARGDYLAFLDADDLFAPSMLQTLHAKAVADSADVVISGFRSFDDTTGEEKSQKWALRSEHLPTATPFAPQDIATHLFYVTNPANWNKLFRREFVADHGIRFQHLKRSNDAYFTFISLAKARRISYIQAELVRYRVGNTTSLQGSIHETPLEFVEALSELHRSLREAGLDGVFHTAFINLVATMSMGALVRAKTADTFITTYTAIRDDLFPRFGVSDAESTVFLQGYVRRNVADIIRKPAAVWLFDSRASLSEKSARSEGSSDEQPVLAQGAVCSRSENAPRPEQRPDVSVIVPVFNSARWLHECLLSVLGQSQVSLEVICVNDGSTDESLGILNEYATIDDRVIVVNRPNGGLSAARNAGLEVARGRYTIFLDSDDYWKTDGLAALVAQAERGKLDVLLFDAESFFEPGVAEKSYQSYATYYERKRSFSEPTSGAQLISTLMRANGYRASACLYLARTDLVQEAGLRFIPGIVHEDNPYTFTLLLNAQRAAHEKVAFYARRVRPGSIMTQGSSERSMRGYYVSYLEMYRQSLRHSIPSEWAADVALLLQQIYLSARKLFVELPDDSGDKLRDVDKSAEGLLTFLLLRRDRNQARQIQQLSK